MIAPQTITVRNFKETIYYPFGKIKKTESSAHTKWMIPKKAASEDCKKSVTIKIEIEAFEYHCKLVFF
ncbi:hypothetical protein B9T34_10075 [Acinetobacter sp. ANC 3813]|nr:hypothetical protein B9T34_10075 [Acinetobacter sp. ANC 3813]